MAVITISRQLESLGDDVARLVAGKLGYQIFDKKAMAQVGQEMGLAASVITEAAEFRPAAKSLLERWFGNAQDLLGSRRRLAGSDGCEPRRHYQRWLQEGQCGHHWPRRHGGAAEQA
jgi:hypothetical protein